MYENENFKNDLILGLDTVQKFGLTHDEKLNITFQNTKLKVIDEKTADSAENKNFDETLNEKFDSKYEINFNEFVNTNEFEIDVDHLDDKKNAVKKLVNKYADIFAKDKYDVGKAKHYEAFIDLQIEQQVAHLLKKGLIEDSYSPFAAPVTLAFKKEENEKNRLCVDFRELNKIIVPQAQPFPLIEDLMVKMVGCKYFTTLDVNSAFWSIP